ncbi:fumarylacetoacetate hydrolase family protein [Streptomyces sp. MB22_4]|uniref:fumarylacetoacetate hydrolase family protein n=1 Tax=Streptomyces sp. MB22_4 TaxID=3383120 RepID=UPI0039A181DF
MERHARRDRPHRRHPHRRSHRGRPHLPGRRRRRAPAPKPAAGHRRDRRRHRPPRPRLAHPRAHPAHRPQLPRPHPGTTAPLPRVSDILSAKFASTPTGPRDTITLPRVSDHIDGEAELAVVVGRRQRSAEAWLMGYPSQPCSEVGLDGGPVHAGVAAPSR